MPSDEPLDASSQEIVLTLALTPDAGVTVPVDSVCELLLTEFPGAVITAPNSFAAERLSIESLRKRSQEQLRQGTLEPWAWKTMEELNVAFDQAIAHNQRVELRSGPKKDLTIPLGSGNQLHGYVGAKAVRLRGPCSRSNVTVAHLVRFLESLNLGKVEIIDHGPTPSSSEILGQG